VAFLCVFPSDTEAPLVKRRAVQEWFLSERGEELTPIEVQDPPAPEPMMEIPPHNGIGDPEDSLQNVLHLIAKPPKRDFKKFMVLDRKILRFEAHMCVAPRWPPDRLTAPPAPPAPAH
jgi:hypothetical protein